MTMNRKWIFLLIVLALNILVPSQIMARLVEGTIEMTVGETRTIMVDSEMRYYMNIHKVNSYRWKAEDNNIKIIKQNLYECVVEAVKEPASELIFTVTFQQGSETWDYSLEYIINIKPRQPDPTPVKEIKLNTTYVSLDLKDNNSYQLIATVLPDNATNKSVTWESNADDVATVSSSGLITAKAAGSATITCKANDGSGTQATCSVTVTAADSIRVTEISLNYTSTSMVVGDTKQLSAAISPSDATDKTVSWSSSNNDIASVDNGGKVTAKARGTAVITCKANDGSGVKATCDIMVANVKPYTKFTANTIEGVEMTFYSRNDGTCYVYAPLSSIPSIDINTTGKITIPEEVEGLQVTSIGSYAFNNCTGITEVIVPNGVETIGYSAFRGCTALSKVSLGNSVKSLDSQVFDGCTSLTTITGISHLESIGGSAFNITYNTFIPWFENLPDGLLYLGKVLYQYKGTMPDNTTINVKEGTTQIGYRAFYDCNGLFGISIPQSLNSIDSYAFENCPNLASITVASGNEKYDSRSNCNAIVETEKNMIVAGCKGTTIPNTITAIGSHAFYGSGLTEVVLSNSIDSIARNAFAYSTSLKSVMIGKGTRKIMDDVFIGCKKITTINVASNNPYYDSRDNCNAIIEKSTDKLIVGCPSTVIPASVKAIGDYSISSLGYSSLYSLIIPDNVEMIGNYAVRYNYNLQSLTLGKEVKEIGKSAFEGCNALRCIRSFVDSPANIDESVFRSNYTDHPDSIYNSATLYVPIGSKINYMNSVGWNKFKNIVEIADDVIPAGTVFKSKSTEGAELMFMVTDSDRKTCELIGSTTDISGKVTIPANPEGYTLRSIGKNAFYSNEDDRSMTEIVIPEGVINLCEYALYSKNGTLRSVTLPSTLTTIGNYAFNESVIKSIFIPKSVSEIGYGVFSRCNDLEVISVDPENAYFYSSNGCNAIIEKTSGKLIAGCKTTTIPDNVTAIGRNAIYYIKGLTDIVIPASVCVIEKYAFGSCKNLTSVTSYIQEPFEIDSLAFSNYEGYLDGKSVYRFTDATLYVPFGTKAKYQATDGWKYFKSIIEKPVSGIKGEVIGDNKSAKVYDLYGRKRDMPRKGINIINGKKFVVK